MRVHTATTWRHAQLTRAHHVARHADNKCHHDTFVDPHHHLVSQGQQPRTRRAVRASRHLARMLPVALRFRRHTFSQLANRPAGALVETLGLRDSDSFCEMWSDDTASSGRLHQASAAAERGGRRWRACLTLARFVPRCGDGYGRAGAATTIRAISRCRPHLASSCSQ